jgi:hypothetical protein
VLIAGGAMAAAAAGGGFWMSRRGNDYEIEARALWTPRDAARIGGLVHYATLAANSHNAQPWRFRASRDGVSILPDLSRALPLADPDNHHLYASLGCAAENLLLAAAATGRSGTVQFDAAGAGQVDIALGSNGTRDPLFDAILERQCTRSDYDARPVPAADLAALEAAARVEGCELLFVLEPAGIEQVLELVLAANAAQVGDPAFAAELRGWIRFSAGSALAHRDGLYSACSGNPALPDFLGRRLFGLVFTPAAENARYARQVRSSSGLAVIVSDRDDPAHWVQAGRSYQRFALQATRLGIRHAHLNQPLEVAAVRPRLQSLLRLCGRRPDLLLRFGHAPPMPRSLRRPVEAVLQA